MSSSKASGTSGRISRTRGGSSMSNFAKRAKTCVPGNACRPVKHSNNTQPSEKISIRPSNMSRGPLACSGAIYPGVPINVPVTVNAVCELSMRAMPKSNNLTRRISPPGKNMFPGLISRCTIPRTCAAPKPLATPCARSSTSSMRSGPSSSRSISVCPSSHSIAK